MRREVFAGILVLVMFFGVLVGCDKDENNEEDDGIAVEWTNFTGADRSILVTNKTGERLVAFKGTPSVNTLISGIPGGAEEHGLKRSDVFKDTGEFPLVLVKESVIAKSSDLSKISVDDYFATIYAFFNTTAGNDTVFQISSSVGGEGELILINMTAWNVEFRHGNAWGPALGYITPSTPRSLMRLKMGEYYIFPVFRKMHPMSKEVYTVIPRFPSGTLEGQPFFTQINLSSSHRTETFNVLNSLGSAAPNISLGGALIRVNNMNTGTHIQFQRGSDELLTTHGAKTIPVAQSAYYQINFSISPNGQFYSNYTIDGLQVGSGGSMLPLGEFTFELDTEYEIRVGGTNASNAYIIPVTAQEAANNSPFWKEGDLIRYIAKINVNAFFDQFSNM